MGIFFGGSGHGPESLCQISVYYKFFQGKRYFYRTNIGGGNVPYLPLLHGPNHLQLKFYIIMQDFKRV